jgi:hypothetical protein
MYLGGRRIDIEGCKSQFVGQQIFDETVYLRLTFVIVLLLVLLAVFNLLRLFAGRAATPFVHMLPHELFPYGPQSRLAEWWWNVSPWSR